MAVIAYVDGASRGQGRTNALGDGALGVVIYRNNQLICQFARGLGKCDNNAAEFEAILAALLLCWAAPGLPDPIIYSDSQLVVNLITRKWVCTNQKLLPLLLSVWEILDVFRARIQYVPRTVVREADRLANLFLDKLYADPLLDP